MSTTEQPETVQGLQTQRFVFTLHYNNCSESAVLCIVLYEFSRSVAFQYYIIKWTAGRHARTYV